MTDSTAPSLSEDLKSKGIKQIEQEIKLLEQWLAELDETSTDNTASVAARKNYMDMIQCRRDFLELLR